jgi:SAM-dependent methyltransferase
VLNILNRHKLGLTEDNFNSSLPENLQKKSKRFFTPFHVAHTATDWLTEDGPKRILDIGAGVGKFCIAGATYSNSNFFGIEYRPSLAIIANELIIKFNIANAVVQQGDITEIDFTNFDAFYLYNPFFENLLPTLRLNNEVELTASLYAYYFKHTEKQFEKTKSGTRLVTYHGNNFEVPSSFSKVKESKDGTLKLWIKQ